MKVGDEQSTFVAPKVFFLKNLFSFLLLFEKLLNPVSQMK